MLNTDQGALRRILLQQSAKDFRALLLPSREPLTKYRALSLVSTGTYVYKTDKAQTRVKWIQALDTAPELAHLPPRPVFNLPWQGCYRTCFAPSIPVSENWAR